MGLVMKLGRQREERFRVRVNSTCPTDGEVHDARVILKYIKTVDVVSNDGTSLTQDVFLHVLTEPRSGKVATDIHPQACRHGSEFNGSTKALPEGAGFLLGRKTSDVDNQPLGVPDRHIRNSCTQNRFALPYLKAILPRVNPQLLEKSEPKANPRGRVVLRLSHASK